MECLKELPDPRDYQLNATKKDEGILEYERDYKSAKNAILDNLWEWKAIIITMSKSVADQELLFDLDFESVALHKIRSSI